jgi:lipid II:glycine glycyltransferase (peptidoglycan interpeptide bridge formation enzyme)
MPSLSFYGHVIHLERGPEALFAAFDSPLQRGIRKAEGAGLKVEFSTSPEAMRDYYALHCQTRRRHGVPPQPFRFFENIASFVLARDHGYIATARLQGRAVAAAVFFHFGGQAIYKFGASDFRFQHLRPNNLVMWETIKRCAAGGFLRLHLGRTSLAHEGLRRFKLALGAREGKVEYYKYDFAQRAFVTDVDRVEGWFNHLFRCLPPPLLRLAGIIMYPHLS